MTRDELLCMHLDFDPNTREQLEFYKSLGDFKCLFFRSSGFAIYAFDHREMGDCCTCEVSSVSKVPSYCDY
jgi:hypothetical protein